MRGKRTLRPFVDRNGGLIPACAGKTGYRIVFLSVCGGSSPRVRGKPRHFLSILTLSRLIPACAGKTVRLILGGCVCRAHPRVCGENWVHAPVFLSSGGSSPRVRGKQTGKLDAVLHVVAHPRVCGENHTRPHLPVTALGSSPRVRGKLTGEEKTRARQRLIPACAGKTQSTASPRATNWAHPRVCGENLDVLRRKHRALGSSPRVRGKHLHTKTLSTEGGLIPACAGKTAFVQCLILDLWAHPRVCGENIAVRNDPVLASGSSPRVRGKLFLLWE